MVRRRPQPEATQHVVLDCQQVECPTCGHLMHNKYDNHRRVRTLSAVVHLQLKVRRCVNAECRRYRHVYRPECESQWALPQQEFGLDVMAYAGGLRYREHRSVTEIHQCLEKRGVSISARSVSNLLASYEELVALRVTDLARLHSRFREQKRVILAIDGLQPDVGHEVLWVIRECISGEILLARTLLSACQDDLAELLREVKANLPVPIAGVVSDGQQSIRKAVAKALPGVAHGLCQFHYLREAVKPIYEADRHAKKELKKRVRGVRPLERKHDDGSPEAAVVQGYCQAVRTAITDDGLPPLNPAGLRLHQRLSAIEQSLTRLEQSSPCPHH